MANETLYVDNHYVANAEYEEIVFGKDLRNGMIVLVEEQLLRADLDHMANPHDKARADECNRWCEVSRVEIVPRPQYDPLVQFVGLYPDGTMRVRRYAASHAWIVKRTPEADRAG